MTSTSPVNEDDGDLSCTFVEENQMIEVVDREIDKDERMLPVHFMPEGRQCYDWVNKKLESYLPKKGEAGQKTRTKSVNSVTYASSNMTNSNESFEQKNMVQSLLKAAEDGDLDCLKDILGKNPLSVNATDSDGYAAVHRASYSGHENILLYLLEHGGNVYAKTNDGWQPIHCAARWNKVNICKILLDHNADVNAKTKGSQTPLHFAALSQDNKELLEMLLLRPDIQANVQNAAGDIPYDLAHRSGPQVQLFEMIDEGLKI